MVGTSVLPQGSHWNQNTLANSSRRQAPSSNQVIQRALADATARHPADSGAASLQRALEASCQHLVENAETIP
jgi:hypothetical protein